ncbi:hypothetical protein KAR91_22930 [Candidatus Pacearchaeota archaeon]|nr:hypothetical protein [Candidatus Pacearchaeota archaeon]
MIVAAAIKDGDGKIYTLPPPARHHTILNHMHDIGIYGSHLDGQGFIDKNGNWLNREESAKIALENGQCKELVSPPNLFSEDLW